MSLDVANTFKNVDEDYDYDDEPKLATVTHLKSEDVLVDNPSNQISEIEDIHDLTPQELLNLWCRKYKETHGFEYRTQVATDRKRMSQFLEQYGPDCGPMIIHMFDTWGGKFNDQTLSTIIFTPKWKWLLDICYPEVRSGGSKKQKVASIKSGVVLSGSDFLKKFSVGS